MSRELRASSFNSLGSIKLQQLTFEHSKFWKILLGSMVWGFCLTLPSHAADRINFTYPPFGDFDISVRDLELFANEGRITSDFGFYTNRANKEQLNQFREFLQTKFKISPILVSQFTYSPIGEKILDRLGNLVMTESRINGAKALRASLILSAADSQGLSLTNVLRKYPSNTIHLNLNGTLDTIQQLSSLLAKRDTVVAEIQKLAVAETNNKNAIDFPQQPDIRKPGNFKWDKQTIALHDTSRDRKSESLIIERKYEVDLYVPQSLQKTPFPVIVISHGLAEDKTTFTYLAQHLASYGFAVAALNHPGNTKEFQQFLSGMATPPRATELIDRPLDVKYLLDEMQRLNDSDTTLQGKFNLQQVGVIGHSLGGYTALALAGGQFDFAKVRKECNPNRSLNVSVFLQCRANEIKPGNYPVKDERVKAIFVMNPLGNTIFGDRGISNIKIPTTLVASSQDIITPSVPEQVFPFVRINSQNKYLLMLENGTHFSVTNEVSKSQEGLPVPQGLIGPDRAIARNYMTAYSLAFFKNYLTGETNYQAYLNNSYAEYINQPAITLSVLTAASRNFLLDFVAKLYKLQPLT
jgi:predicted dienelactone hydrolase